MKRYAVNISAYIYAEDDEQAVRIAHHYERHLDNVPNNEDNKAKAYHLCEMPFGYIGEGRKVTI